MKWRTLFLFLLPSIVLADISGIVVDRNGTRIPSVRLLYKAARGTTYFASDSDGSWRLGVASIRSRSQPAGGNAPSRSKRIFEEGGHLRFSVRGLKVDGSSSPVHGSSGTPGTQAVSGRALAWVGESLFVDIYGRRRGATALTSHDTSGIVLVVDLDLRACGNADAKDSLLDCRDGKSYRLVQLAGRKWTTRNLAYVPEVWKGVNCPKPLQIPNAASYLACGDSLGYVYSWETFEKTACPTGSHLPRGGEWDSLVVALGGPVVADSVLRSKEFLKARWKYTDSLVADHFNDESGFGALNSPYQYNPSWLPSDQMVWMDVGWLVATGGFWPEVFALTSSGAQVVSADRGSAPVRCVFGK